MQNNCIIKLQSYKTTLIGISLYKEYCICLFDLQTLTLLNSLLSPDHLNQFHQSGESTIITANSNRGIEGLPNLDKKPKRC